MDQSAYVAGFFGVLIGITLTELIRGIAETVRNAKRIEYYFPHGILVLAIFLVIVQSFFDFQWLTRGISTWTPLLIIRYTLPWVIICLGSYLVFPAFDGEKVVNFKEHFNRFVLGSCKVTVVLVPLIIIHNITSMDYELLHVENIVMTILLTTTVLTIILKKDWLILVPLCVVTTYLIWNLAR